ncbi:MAG: cytochrome c [Mesorhizobium sp.]|nr:MAG: cytochrome c [Mesorhizobium sp.]
MRSRIILRAVLLALAGPSLAAGPGDTIVAARQASMKEMAAAARAIAEMFDGKRAYEPAAFKAAADTLSARAGGLTGEFPQGTLGAPSAARPEIDQARPEFEALARHIGRLADAEHLLHLILQDCTSCHSKFRQKQQ